MKGLVIWAHSKCRSTYDLYREVVRQAPVPVRLVFWKGALDVRIEQGFAADDYEDVPSAVIGDDRTAADRILSETAGWTHVVAAYQVAAVMQHVMRTAKARGDRVVVYSEAPCEMCVGWKAWAKRVYYRLVLPRKLRKVVATADCILSQSGTMGRDRLMRLGWKVEQIIPFGYVSPRLGKEGGDNRHHLRRGKLQVLHLGSEAKYRGLEIAVKACAKLGDSVALRRTGGSQSIADVVEAIRSADLVVGCGLCEPWGMRINDALLEGTPVVVSDGMGVAWMVEQFGCGCVVPKGDVVALARVLKRCAADASFLDKLRSGAEKAAREWTPSRKAKEFFDLVLRQ